MCGLYVCKQVFLVLPGFTEQENVCIFVTITSPLWSAVRGHFTCSCRSILSCFVAVFFLWKRDEDPDLSLSVWLVSRFTKGKERWDYSRKLADSEKPCTQYSLPALYHVSMIPVVQTLLSLFSGFLLPVLQSIHQSSSDGHSLPSPYALVLAPSPELAVQVRQSV